MHEYTVQNNIIIKYKQNHFISILTKMLSDAISEHLFFKIFLGGMPPDPLVGAC